MVGGYLDLGAIFLKRDVFHATLYYEQGRHFRWVVPLANLAVMLVPGVYKIGSPIVVADFDGTLAGAGVARTTITCTDEFSYELWQQAGGDEENRPPDFPRVPVDGSLTKTPPTLMQFYKTPLRPGEDAADRANRIVIRDLRCDLCPDDVDVLAQFQRGEHEPLAHIGPGPHRLAQPVRIIGRKDGGMAGPIHDIGGRPQIFPMRRPTAPRGRIGEIEREFAADQRQGAGARHGGIFTNHLNPLYRLLKAR